MEDTSLDPIPTQEELEEQLRAEQDAEFARRVRREVKRIESGEADEDMAQDEAEEQQQREFEEAEREAANAKEAKARRWRQSTFWLLISGNILVRRGVSKYYSQMVLVAVIFFVSIFVMFWSLHLDMRYSDTARKVQLLREKSVRLQEMRYSKCSHSAITKELKRRGIDLADATQPAVVIKD